MPPAIFDATQQQRRTVVQPRRAGIEHGVRGIRPITRAQDRVRRMAVEQLGVAVVLAHDKRPVPIGRRIAPMRSDELSSNSARRNDNVDSAPWFLLMRSA